MIVVTFSITYNYQNIVGLFGFDYWHLKGANSRNRAGKIFFRA
jgi:hypothetical protein